MKKILSIACAALMGGAFATDWTIYTPGQDVYLTDASETYTVTDNNFETFNGLGLVNLGEGVTLELQLDNDHTLTHMVRDEGLLIKSGSGTLTLGATKKREESGWYTDFHTRELQILGGEIRIAQGDADWHVRLGQVTMAAGTILTISDATRTLLDALNGSGDVIKPGETRDELIIGVGWDGYPKTFSEFSGKLSGPFDVRNDWTLKLVGTENDFTGGVQPVNDMDGTDPDRGVLEVATIGAIGEPSSVGTFDNVQLRYGAVLKYANPEPGETIGKGLTMMVDENRPIECVFDAGVGDFRWEGQFFLDDTRFFSRLTLTGDNEAAATMAGPVKWANYVNGYNVYLTKTGTGVWRFEGHAERTMMRGPFAVQEGTLQYTSLANAGELCSLGLSTMLYDAPLATNDNGDTYKVDYAFLLGGGKDPVFEYVGEGESETTNRLIALTGTKSTLSYGLDALGTLRLMGGVKALDAGEKELHLKADENATAGRAVIGDIADGAGRVSVVKDGPGTWTLGGKELFTGGVKVNEGTLVVTGCQSPRPYRWYRFTVLGSGYTESLSPVSQIMIKRLGLFDASGKEIGLDFEEVRAENYDEAVSQLPENVTTVKFTADKFNWRNLEPGQCTFGEFKGELNYSLNDPLANLFSLVPQCFNCSMDGSVEPTNQGYPLPIIFRLREDTASVAYYDVCPHTDYTTTHTYAFKLEGSVDGKAWTELHRVMTDAKRKEAQWYSTGVASPRPVYNHAA